MTRAGKWLTAVGAVILVAGVVGGVLIAVNGFRSVLAFGDEEIKVNGPGNSITHHFDAGEKIALYTYGANGVYVGPTPKCDVTGPAPLKPGSSVVNSVTVNQRSRISFASFVVEQSGQYRFTCDQSGVTIAPPLSSVGILGGVGGIFLAVFAGIIGVVLLLVGIVLWVVGRGRARSAPVGPQTDDSKAGS